MNAAEIFAGLSLIAAGAVVFVVLSDERKSRKKDDK